MILSFTIENFRSIKSPITIDFTAEKRLYEDDLPHNSFIQNKNELVKSLVLYGRNASGKSNILLAFDALSILIKNSDNYKHEEEILLYEPFLFDNNFKNHPVTFEVVFISVESKIKYKYSISYNSTEITYEALYFYPENVKAKLFERKKQKISYGEYYRGTKKNIESDLLQNQLFLSKSSTSKIKYLDEVYLYFSASYSLSLPSDFELKKGILNFFWEFILEKENIKSNLMELLKAADTSILDFNITENKMEFPHDFSDEAKREILDKYKFKVLTSHSLFENDNLVGKTTLEIEKESLGTKKLLSIGTIIIAKLATGGILFIDELDKGLHPLLSKMIIKLFNSKKNNPKNAQLIFATHDSTLLDTEIFRRDQICFVDKDYQGGSTFYKLSDIKGIRKDIPVDKWYLSGRFKAIPVISEPQLKF